MNEHTVHTITMCFYYYYYYYYYYYFYYYYYYYYCEVLPCGERRAPASHAPPPE